MPKQYFKALYFSDYPSDDSRDKSITVAFSEPEIPYYSKIKEMSTPEIKDLIGVQTYLELSDVADQQERSINQVIKRLIKQNLGKIDKTGDFTDKDVTFVNSKQLPFQRWYPYIEGYSPDFVKSLIKEFSIREGALIYEPFAGTGTTIFAADSAKISTVYSEVNPLLQFLIQVKIEILKSSKDIRQKLANNARAAAKNILERLEECEINLQLKRSYDVLFGDSKYFPDETFAQVLKLRTLIDNIKLEDELLANVLSIAVFSCLLPVSFLKKAGDVRFKTSNELEKDMKVFSEVLPEKLIEMAEDIANFDCKLNIKHEFIIGNAKNISRIKDVTIDAIITSPPYLNGTNYFRNTKLELWFLRYLQYENDLRLFRDQALTSGINDVKKAVEKRANISVVSKSKILKLTLKELLENNYDSRIPVMVESYFQEMYEIFKDARKYLRPNCKVLIDIGDSIFCGVHIKTDEVLIEILKKLRYKLLDNQTLRKRRSKNKEILTQSLITFEFSGFDEVTTDAERHSWKFEWKNFKETLPHQQEPFSKKNWGHSKHSLCSYQGKLKPAIANKLVKTFVPEGGSLLDPFSGVGTIPFEAALAGKMAYGIDISLP
ncbi:MAG: hypothetical protein JST32_04585, partial [Bacteroidetes bacterium]|nr:hypothetical protein [Bacteroidota bacterium]